MTKKVIWLCFFIGFMVLIAPFSSAFAGPKEPRVKVMTRNLYLGADIFKIAEAAPANIPYVVAEVFNTMLYTNFWARAEAIADEIMYADVEVIGLQEVSTFYKQTPGDFLAGNPTPATTEVIDFYTVLNDALESRGLFYAAYVTTNSDVELPMADLDAGPPYYLSDVRMVDHDVILVKSNYNSTQVQLPPPYNTNNFVNNLSLEISGTPVTFTRGFGIVNIDIKGTIFRFVNTHLEVASSVGSPFRLFQSAQMQELLGILDILAGYDSETIPVIMVGDFNSSSEDMPGIYDPDGAGPHPGYAYVPPYMLATNPIYGGHHLDTWLEQINPNKDIYGEGYTSGFEETIDDPYDTLETRIDHVFLDPGDLILKKSRNEVLGDDPSEMVENLPDFPGEYLWPSDHAGVTSKMQFLNP
jgi:hypothetical protein